MPSPLSIGNRMFLIGITGTMGCGKSTVTKLFAKRGARLLDADQMARDVVAPGRVGWQEVVDCFGEQILMAADESVTPEALPQLDRKKLGELVFADPLKRKMLEGIIHPKIAMARAEKLKKWQQELVSGGEKIVVMEIPLLFEVGFDAECDLTLAVICGNHQWQRLAERRTMSDEIKRAAIAEQLPEAEKKSRSDRIIDNSGSLDATDYQVELLWSELKS